MKFAILSDIHANYFALKKVLDEARSLKIDRLLVLGDLIGYYYDPDFVIDALDNWNAQVIKGNHEDLLNDLKNGSANLREITSKYGSGHKVVLDKLNDSQLNFLQALPEKIKIEIDDISILMAHGSPWDKDLYLYPDTDASVLEKFFDYPVDLIFIGHTHYSCFFRVGKTLVINPGSVGQSREKGGLADWVVFDTANRSFRFMKTGYNTKDLIELVKSIDPEIQYNHKILSR